MQAEAGLGPDFAAVAETYPAFVAEGPEHTCEDCACQKFRDGSTGWRGVLMREAGSEHCRIYWQG